MRMFALRLILLSSGFATSVSGQMISTDSPMPESPRARSAIVIEASQVEWPSWQMPALFSVPPEPKAPLFPQSGDAGLSCVQISMLVGTGLALAVTPLFDGQGSGDDGEIVAADFVGAAVVGFLGGWMGGKMWCGG